MLTVMQQKTVYPLPLLFLFCLATGCVNLKAVNAYSTKALQNLEQYDSLGYSFKQACFD